MKVKIKTPDGKPLLYESHGACGFDFKAKEDIVINPGEMKLMDTGTVIEVPKGYVLQILPRSSTFKRYSLIQVNSTGIIDNDYCGNTDTIGFQYLNMGKEQVKIKAGTRIGQGVFLQVGIADFEVVDNMENKNRGGFGSTGEK